MRKMGWVFIIFCVVSIILYFGVVFPDVWNSDDRFYGQLVFEDEKEYAVFKQEVINAGGEWITMDVMSSSPPILVKFNVTVNKDYIFPYGERSRFYIIDTIVSIVLLFIMLFISYFSMLVVSSSLSDSPMFALEYFRR